MNTRVWCMSAYTLVLSLLLCSCAATQPASITILHTNDMHASFLPREAGWVQTESKPLVGGFLALSRLIDSLRNVKQHVLLLDGGDVMTGTPISEYEYAGTKGGALFTMMNAMKYDAWTIGNHDLDISQQNLKELSGIVKFHTLSANLVDSSGKFPFNNKEYAIIERGGLKIGIFGLMSKDLFRLTNTANLKGLKVLPPVETAQRIVNVLEPLTDIIIGVTHEGVDEDSILAVQTNGIDVIIGGHSHTRVRSPKKVNGVLICQAGANSENLGVLDIVVDNDSVVKADGRLISTWVTQNKTENELSRLVNEFKTKIDQEFGEELGVLEIDWKRSGSKESEIGSFIADAIREGTGAHITVTNSSGIRKDLRSGPVRKLDLFEISPFRNYLSVFPVRGSQIRTMLQRHIEMLADGKSPIQFSGISCSWKKGGAAPALENVSIGSEPLEDAKIYTMGTSDFVIDQGDKYLGFTPEDVTFSRTTIFESLIMKVKKDKSIKGNDKPRFTELQ